MRTLLRFTFGTMLAAVLALGAGRASAQSIGSAMPAASQTLPNATGPAASLSELAGNTATAVIFWSNQCPWTARYEDRVLNLARQYQGQGVQFVLINANSASDFPQESLEASRQQAGSYPMPYLKDQSGQVAEAFGAVRTPHVFVYNRQGQLAYTGAIDDSPGDPSAVEKPYLDNALEALANGNAVPTPRTNAFGCTLRD